MLTHLGSIRGTGHRVEAPALEALHERELADLRTQNSIARVLAESASLEHAAPRILRAICEHLSWQVGALWCVDDREQVIRCVDVDHLPGVEVPQFVAISRSRTFERGIGLPGRVWADEKAVWIGDVVVDVNFPRASIAAAEGLHTAFGFPITLNREVVGVMEFFSADIREPDHHLLEMMTAVGTHIGQFLERRRAEDALRASEARKAAILETALDCIITIDHTGAILDFNPAAERTFGLPRTKAIGQDMATLIVPPSLRERHRQGMARYVATGEGPILNRRIEMPALRADGTEFPVELTVTRIPGDGPPLFTAYVRDITDRKHAEAALKKSEQALRQLDRRKDEFLAILAHELRNPLAPIRNAVQIFRSNPAHVPELQWATDVIDRQVHQLTRLVDDLLDVSRITRGNVELRKERVLLGDVISSAVEASRPVVQQWGHELSVSLPPQTITLEADPTRMSQVFSNLLNNAAKYTDRGGRIECAVEYADGDVVVRVKDNGIGIAHEMLERVFELFVQGDHAWDRSEGGLGIGLTLVRRLVEMHGGSVHALSGGAGMGSEFVVRLPVAVEQAAAAEGPSEGDSESAATSARRILVVDDNRDAADSLGVLLRMMGNDVHTAYDGLEAVGAAAAYQPDVILLDIGLPKLNGYEVARRVREQHTAKSVRLIALTGWGQDEDRRRAKAAGFDEHLTKPVEFNVLQKLLG